MKKLPTGTFPIPCVQAIVNDLELRYKELGMNYP